MLLSFDIGPYKLLCLYFRGQAYLANDDMSAESDSDSGHRRVYRRISSCSIHGHLSYLVATPVGVIIILLILTLPVVTRGSNMDYTLATMPSVT